MLVRPVSVHFLSAAKGQIEAARFGGTRAAGLRRVEVFGNAAPTRGPSGWRSEFGGAASRSHPASAINNLASEAVRVGVGVHAGGAAVSGGAASAGMARLLRRPLVPVRT
jgi:hypothetical protein